MNKIKKGLKRIKYLLRRENKYIPTGYKNSKDIYNSNPKISILLPVYNHAKVVKYAINSILNQSYQNIELIILDDGSTDNLQEELKRYYSDSRVKIFYQKNQKLPRALTHLHKLATGNFITWTSADNIMHRNMIEILVHELMLKPDAALVYGDVYVINKNNHAYYGICRDAERDYKKPNIIRLNRNEKPLSIGNDNYINASFLYRKENSDIILGKYADDIIGAEDYDFWLRLQKTGKLTHIKNQKPLYYYRVHDNSMSHELETKKVKEHQSRLENLQRYEQERINWCNKRININIEENQENEKIKNLFLQLPIDINDTKNSKRLSFSKQEKNNEIYYQITTDYYILKSKNNEEIVQIFRGINIPRETYKARNLYSHAYYQDDLIRIKNPIFGCHVNSSTLDENELITLLQNNKNITFVILDEIENSKIKEIIKNYQNLLYYPNKSFGIDYQTYSYFSRIISFKSISVSNKYKCLLLGYAIGRRISYHINDAFFTIFPYTISYEQEIEFYESDGISDFDYTIMNNYIEEYSEIGSLKKCLRYYNGYTQEMFIKRPKYIIDKIAEESEPKQIN